jgi:CDP-paratose 2-epimerase
MSKYCIVTGSSGLVGSEAVQWFSAQGYNVIGIDNDMRRYFFGTSTSTITQELKKKCSNYIPCDIDIRDKESLEAVYMKYAKSIECIIHCAAQPSHDWAAKEPETDFMINATATLYLLELTRKYCCQASFIYMSTNKVYGDRPNSLELIEYDKRYDTLNNYAINEDMSVDNCKHSIFGVSKLAADVMVQEYGRYFGMNTVVFRAGCITGANHQGAELHGFLSYLVKCIMNEDTYTIYGYKGKQVRDNIHAADLVQAFWQFHNNPKQGAIYNIGGGRNNSTSILEVIDTVNSLLSKSWNKYILTEEPRSGDHQWYITDNSKFKNDYPEWDIKHSMDDILSDIICAQVSRQASLVE